MYLNHPDFDSGSILIVNKLGKLGSLIKHFGVYFENFFGHKDVVVEAVKGEGVTVTPLEEFLEGRRIENIEVNERPFSESVADIKDRARSILGRAYDELSKNCEHTANFIQKGKHMSGQVRVGFVGVGLAALFFLTGSN